MKCQICGTDNRFTECEHYQIYKKAKKWVDIKEGESAIKVDQPESFIWYPIDGVYYPALPKKVRVRVGTGYWNFRDYRHMPIWKIGNKLYAEDDYYSLTISDLEGYVAINCEMVGDTPRYVAVGELWLHREYA